MLVSMSPCCRASCATFVALLGLMRVRARKSSPSTRKMAQNGCLTARWANFFAEMRLEGPCLASILRGPAVMGSRRASLLCRVPGTGALLLAPLTRSCAAKPHWWHGGQPAQATTSRVNVCIGGPRPPPIGLTCASVGLRRHLTGPRAQDAFTETEDGPEGLAGLPTIPMPPRRRQRRDPEGSRPSLRTVTAPSVPKSRYKTNTFCPLTHTFCPLTLVSYNPTNTVKRGL